MSDDLLLKIAIPMGALIFLALGIYLFKDAHRRRIQKRIDRVTHRKASTDTKTVMNSLRKANESALPLFLAVLLRNIPTISSLQIRLERAGIKMPADIYVTMCAGICLIIGGGIFFLKNSPGLAVFAGIICGFAIPHIIVGFKGKSRGKKFLKLFPDAIDFIVRGLRSGLPIVESFNVIGNEMEEPLKDAFLNIGEQVRLGMPLEKALQEISNKLGLAEFNFFVTTIILQRETGGNLSEILNNLGDVLRKRFMMRMKIKAMAAEAKASAMIVGSLPFVVLSALMVISPDYLRPLFDDPRGKIALAGAAFSLLLGIGIMFKMATFEI